MTLNDRAKQLKTEIPALFLALKHSSTPLPAKLLAGIAVLYALSPIDLIPDFIPVLGYLDDVLLLPALVLLTRKLIPPEIMAQCREAAEGLWQEGKPKKWYYALPIVCIWVLFLWLVIKSAVR